MVPASDGLAPGKPSVSESIDAAATSVASVAAENHETASSTRPSCAAMPTAAAPATTSITER